MGQHRVKFATQVDESVLLEIRQLAKAEGRQLQSIVEEAFKALLEEREGNQRPADDVMALAEEITSDYSETLKYLAQ